MTETEIIRALKLNGHEKIPFAQLPRDVAEWIRTHMVLWLRGESMSWPYLPDDYPEPKDRDLLAEAKANTVVWQFMDDELKALMWSLPAGAIQWIPADGGWISKHSMEPWKPGRAYQVKRDYQPEPEPAKPKEPEPPVIPGYRLAKIWQRDDRWYFGNEVDPSRLSKATDHGAVGVVFWHPGSQSWMVVFHVVTPFVVLDASGVPRNHAWALPPGRFGDDVIAPVQYVIFPEAK